MIATRPMQGRITKGSSYTINEGERIPESILEHLDVDALMSAGAIKDETTKAKPKAEPKENKDS